MSQVVLVTGAFGNMGSRVIHYLLEAGHSVIALDRKSKATVAVAGRFSATIKVIWADIREPGVWQTALQGVETVVHLASIIPPFTDHQPQLAIAINQTATLELIQAMEASPTARRLVFASSMILLGPQQHLRTPPVTSCIEPQPSEIYGETKAECERCIRASSLHWTILRFAICPPTEFVVGEVDRLEAILHASPDGRLEIIHPEDAGLAVANTLSCDETIGRILLIGGGPSCQDHALSFYNKLFRAVGLSPIDSSLLRPGPAYFFGDWLDTSESQKLLHYQRHSLDDLLAELRGAAGIHRWLLRAISPLVSPTLKWLAQRKSDTVIAPGAPPPAASGGPRNRSGH